MARLVKSFCAAWLLMMLSAHVAIACETPVYRYAMYRWQPAPYEVYYFHDQPVADQDQQVHQLFRQFERADGARANLALIPVDLSDDPELASVPPDVKRAWDQHSDKTLPTYFISTPYGVGLSFEQFSEDAVRRLVDSPARKSLAAQLETGKLGVFVMLNGKDAAENKAAQKILDGLVTEVRQGQLSLYVSPAEVPEEEAAEAAEPEFDLGVITMDRDDPQEQWFVRSLLAMEPDLAAEDRPMVFLVYGRARALLPYIGKGITRENLVREIEFISGACSCTVKEQNPGVDLLVRYDWDSAAAALAERVGSEEGNESQFGPEMFFPELIIPDNSPPAAGELAATQDDEPIVDNTILEPQQADTVASDESVVEASVIGNPDASPEGAVVEASAAEQVSDADSAATTEPAETADAVEPADAAESAEGREVATVTMTPASPVRTDSAAAADSTMTSVWIVGAAVGVALLVLFGLTFVVLRPQ